ncbi:MAG: hypothetical protein ACRDO8_03350 [Nocardioidaceae bacterium]
MRPVLRPGAPLLRRDAHHLQIGTTPGAAYVVRERPGMLALLRMLDGVRDEHALRDLAGADLPQFEGDPAELVDALRAAHVVLDSEAWTRQPDPTLSGEGRHLAARGTDAASITARLARRSRSRVEVSFDEHTEQMGSHVRAILDGSGVPASLAPVEDPALVVVVTAGPCPRDVFEVLAGAGIAHLPVCCEEDRVRIGPLVRPGHTPCVACDDHQRAAWDPAWPGLLAQLGQPLARPAVVAPHSLSALIAHFVAVVIAEDVLAYCDGLHARAESAAVTVGPQVHELRVEPVAFAPACGCGILSDGGATGVRPHDLAPTGTMEA